jgi:transposase
MAYPLKFREHVFKVQKKEKLSLRELAKRFQIGIATLIRWCRRITPLNKRKKASPKISLEALAEDVKKYPDAYQRERAARFGVSKHGIYWALNKLGVTYKKNPSSTRRLTLLPEKPLKKK